jgi:hypothetical protein
MSTTMKNTKSERDKNGNSIDNRVSIATRTALLLLLSSAVFAIGDAFVVKTSSTNPYSEVRPTKHRTVTTTSPSQTKTNRSSIYPLLSKGTSATIPLSPFIMTTSPFFSRQEITNLSNLRTKPLLAHKKSHSTSTIAVPIVLGSLAPFAIGGSVAHSMDHWDDRADFMSSAIGGSMSSLIGTMASVAVPSTGATSMDPIVEGEIFSGLAHIALDLFTFAAPATSVLRLASFIGRMFAVAADYVPDQNVFPEEMVFQSVMLGVAWFGLVKSLTPMLFAAVASPTITIRDGKAYSVLFQPAGLTWNQFKALSVCALDWITVSPGNIITTDEKDDVQSLTNEQDKEDEYIYWLYSGNVEVQSKGQTVCEVAVQSKDISSLKQNAGRGLLGEVRLLRRMDRGTTSRNKKVKFSLTKEDKVLVDDENTTRLSYPRTTIKAGGSIGATLLRIHTPSLKMLMDTDPHFADSIRTMLLHGMQAKLMAQFEKESSVVS